MSNKAIFLDRDDTLIEDPGYLSDPGQVKLLGGVAKALIRFKDMGYKLVVVTNQSAVARGIITEKVLRKIHDRFEQLLAERDAYLDAIYYCPYHPEGSVAKFRKTSDCRKPNPGMLLTAADELDIDLGESWMIGNARHDVEAGLRAGCKTILIDVPSRQKHAEPGDPAPHYKAVNITEAVNIIKKFHRRAKDPEPPVEPEPTDQTDEDSEPAEPDSTELPPAAEEPQAIADEPEPDPPPEEPDMTAETEHRQSQQSEQQETFKPEADTETTEQLLSRILDQLKSAQRSDMFEEFSTWRFMAGAVQGLVVLCMLITIWLLMSPKRHDTSVLIGLGFAIVLQLMSLTFFVMQDRK